MTRSQRLVDRLTVHSVGIIVAVGIYLLPLLYLLMISLKTAKEFLVSPLAVPHTVQWQNYVSAWQQGSFGQYFINSIIYTVSITVLSLLVSLMVAFPVARNMWKYSNIVYIFFLVSLFLPGGLIALFAETQTLHLFNSRIGYILINIGTGLSFFFFVGYIKTIPKELDEAAVMDGCGYFRFMFTILPPLIRPALATMGLFIAIGAWNNLIGPVVFLSSSSLWPLTRGLFAFYGQFGNNWPLLSAAVIIVMMPLVILFIFLQRYIVQGAMGGAMKQ